MHCPCTQDNRQTADNQAVITGFQNFANVFEAFSQTQLNGEQQVFPQAFKPLQNWTVQPQQQGPKALRQARQGPQQAMRQTMMQFPQGETQGEQQESVQSDRRP